MFICFAQLRHQNIHVMLSYAKITNKKNKKTEKSGNENEE